MTTSDFICFSYFPLSKIFVTKKAGLPLVDIFCVKRLFSLRKFLIIENIKNQPQTIFHTAPLAATTVKYNFMLK